MPRSLNVRRFAGGLATPQEFFAVHALPPGARCSGCGARPMVQARVFLPYDEAVSRGYVPAGHEANPDVISRTLLLKSGSGLVPHIRLSEAYACRLCQPAFERQLAKAPSWAIVEINRGPDPQNRVSLGV